MLEPFVKGFGVGGGLIVAIGAQNAFVLSQGIRQNHHLVIALICSVCDALLICAGVAGVGAMLAANQAMTTVAAWAGAAFLFWYGFRAFRSALKSSALETDDAGPTSLRSAIFITLAVTLLNPHVYLDTVLLLGSISAQIPGMARYLFGAGAMTASVVWFFSLSVGGKLLAPVFRQPKAWKILDGLVCATMWTIAVTLIRQALTG